MFDEQGWHARFVHADGDAVARHARLCHFKYCITNAVSITDTDLVIRKSFDREVLSELTEAKITAAQKVLPVMVRLYLVNEYRTLLPTVTREIGLRVAIDIELARHPPSLNREFPDCCSDSLAVPLHFPWKTDIH